MKIVAIAKSTFCDIPTVSNFKTQVHVSVHAHVHTICAHVLYVHTTHTCSVTLAIGTDSSLSNNIMVSTLRAKSTSLGNPDTS